MMQIYVARSDAQHLQLVTDKPGKVVPEAHIRHPDVPTMTSCFKVLGYFRSLAPAQEYVDYSDVMSRHPICDACVQKKPAVAASFRHLESAACL